MASMLVGLLPQFAAAEPMATASNGARLPMPAIEALTCDARATLLATYSTSNYRSIGLLPENHPDARLFAYEDRLADAFYRECQVGQTFFEDTAPAFASGFN